MHEDWQSAEAIVLSEVLRDVCGLNVSTMNRDVLPSRLILKGVLETMRRSTQVVVLAGYKISGRLQFFISKAATHPSTVTLLVGGQHVPEMLNGHRSMILPSDGCTLTARGDECTLSARSSVSSSTSATRIRPWRETDRRLCVAFVSADVGCIRDHFIRVPW